jgi:Ca2+-binding EF-hand superfamily protein
MKNLALNGKDEINYSDFLAAMVDSKMLLTKQHLDFAFHHFDVDNSGYITQENLDEVFTRQGQKKTPAMI